MSKESDTDRTSSETDDAAERAEAAVEAVTDKLAGVAVASADD